VEWRNRTRRRASGKKPIAREVYVARIARIVL